MMLPGQFEPLPVEKGEPSFVWPRNPNHLTFPKHPFTYDPPPKLDEDADKPAKVELARTAWRWWLGLNPQWIGKLSAKDKAIYEGAPE